MPAVARLGDICTGHGCWPPRPSIEGSLNVFVNDIPVHRQSDAWGPHTCPDIPETHGSVLAEGWPTVFVNNLEVGYIGAPVACGSFIATGSPDVFVGE
ncbi:PAAR domain-containing protein [Acetomicrobium sp. S15 = DSM 107314]|uniref:PAAR domain-containing protein n=1 Tax=Acetomicrobium sp. S15 = DSM 107314 TaxID=2529858 RepID=UPI0018E0E948